LANSTTVDSVVVIWPSGWIDRYYDLPADLHYNFVEGETISNNDVVQMMIICESDSAVLHTSQNQLALWSNNEVASQIVIDEPGFFVASYTDQFGFLHTESFIVSLSLEPAHAVHVIPPSCHGSSDASVEIDLLEESFIVSWNNGYVSNSLEELSAGEYAYFIVDDHNCQFPFSVVIDEPDALTINIMEDTVCSGISTELVYDITGGSGTYFFDWNGIDPAAIFPGAYTMSITDSFGCNESAEFVIHEYDTFNPVIVAPNACYGQPVSIGYYADGPAGDYVFDFDEYDPHEMFAGMYTVVVYDEHFCIQSHEFEIIESDELLASIEIITESFPSQNVAFVNVEGGVDPFSFLWSTGDTSQQIVLAADGFYNCMVTDSMGCSVSAELNWLELKNPSDVVAFSAYPLPCSNQINVSGIKMPGLLLFDSGGRLVKSFLCDSEAMEFDVSDLSAGSYYLLAGSESFKIVKSE
jgi:hypothetical protein